MIRRLKGLIARQPLVQKATGCWAAAPNPDQWVFVIGCYNSGTTLLDRIIQAHPAVSGLPIEGAFMSDALPVPEEFGWTRMWHRCEDQMNLPPEAPDASERAARIKRQWAPWFTDASPILVEKSVANACRISFLDSHFRPARFIHIVRNGYAVSEGIRRKARPGAWNNPMYDDSYPISLCAKQWARSMEAVASKLGVAQKHIELKYESLVQSPSRELKRIADFLGIDSFPNDIADKTWSIHGTCSKLADRNPQSIASLTREDIRTIENVAGPWLDHHGYKPDETS